MKTVSIVIPAYNEERFLGTLLEKILSVPTERCGFKKEIIVVDDGSRDRTPKIAEGFSNQGVTLIRQANQGKGRAVQHGVRQATGEYILVQDADLEYDPADYVPMLAALADNTSVYGSRTLGQMQRGHGINRLLGKHAAQSFGPWIAGVLLTLWTFILYGKIVTDTLTAYKIYPTDVLRDLNILTKGFETDHEITAKLIKRGIQIVEVPIAYFPRSKEEGKKIKMRDGFVAVWTLLRFRMGQ